jgi:flagellar biosynthesis/type III secretory pathway M-ring protein FliF/YscJ
MIYFVLTRNGNCFTHSEYLTSPPVLLVGSMLLIFLVLCVIMLRVVMRSKKNDPEKLATQGTQDEERKKPQPNVCWTALYASKHK